MKEKKNGHLVVAILVVVKACITMVFCVILFQTYEKIVDGVGFIQTANQLKEYEFYELETPVALEEEMIQRINACLHQVDDAYIYNYSSPELLYKKSELKHIERMEEHDGSFYESNYMHISNNLLKYFKIKRTNGAYIRASEIQGEALLVPEYLQDEVPNILEWLELAQSAEIILIENDQCYPDMMWPGLYAYNPIVFVDPPMKELYVGWGDELYDPCIVEEIQEDLREVGIGSSSITFQSRSYSIDTFVSAYYTVVFEAMLFSAIMLFAFLLTDFTLIISYIQFHKKKIGVMVLHGKRVIGFTWKFLLLVIVIDFMAAMVIHMCFAALILFDVFIYCLEMNQTVRKGSTRLINGL